MKKLFPVVCVLGVLLMTLVACSSGGDSDNTDPVDDVVSEKVSEVAPYTPEDIASSGATAQWSSADVFMEDLPRVMRDDIIYELEGILNQMVSGDEDESRINRKSNVTGYRAMSTVEGFIDEMVDAFRDFPQTMEIDKSFSATNSDMGDYYTMNKINCKIKANALTTDDAALDVEEGTNFKSGTGSASFSTEFSVKKGLIPSYSNIKDFKVKMNCSVSGSTESAIEDDYRVMKDLKFSYAASTSIAISYNDGVNGGKIIIVVNTSKPITTIADPNADDDNEVLDSKLAPDVFVASATLYKDDGTKVYEKAYASFEELQNEFDR